MDVVSHIIQPRNKKPFMNQVANQLITYIHDMVLMIQCNWLLNCGAYW